MTMPHLMNCQHQPDGRCRKCETGNHVSENDPAKYYAEQLQQVAEAIGMPLAPGHSIIHRVKELAAHESGPWINIAEHQELQERFKNLAAEYRQATDAPNTFAMELVRSVEKQNQELRKRIAELEGNK